MSIWVDDKLIDKYDGYHFECFEVYVVGDWSLLNELYTFQYLMRVEWVGIGCDADMCDSHDVLNQYLMKLSMDG